MPLYANDESFHASWEWSIRNRRLISNKWRHLSKKSNEKPAKKNRMLFSINKARVQGPERVVKEKKPKIRSSTKITLNQIIVHKSFENLCKIRKFYELCKTVCWSKLLISMFKFFKQLDGLTIGNFLLSILWIFQRWINNFKYYLNQPYSLSGTHAPLKVGHTN